jgi:hypothetical protein
MNGCGPTVNYKWGHMVVGARSVAAESGGLPA